MGPACKIVLFFISPIFLFLNFAYSLPENLPNKLRIPLDATEGRQQEVQRQLLKQNVATVVYNVENDKTYPRNIEQFESDIRNCRSFLAPR